MCAFLNTRQPPQKTCTLPGVSKKHGNVHHSCITIRSHLHVFKRTATHNKTHSNMQRICITICLYQPKKTCALPCILKTCGNAHPACVICLRLRIFKRTATHKNMHTMPHFSETCGNTHRACITIRSHLCISEFTATENVNLP